MNRYRANKGLAHNIADKFATSCEHFAYTAILNHVDKVEINVLKTSITPPQFNSSRNVNLVHMCLDIIRSHVLIYSPSVVRDVRITAEFYTHPDTQQPIGKVTALVTDERGKVWVQTVVNEQQILAP